MPLPRDSWFDLKFEASPGREPALLGLHLPAGGGLLAVAAWSGDGPQVFQATSGGYVAQAFAAWIGAQLPVRGVVLAQVPWQRDADQGAAALWAFSHLALAVA